MNMQPISNFSVTGTKSTTARLSSANQSTAGNTQKMAATGIKAGRSKVSYDVRDLNQDGYVSFLEEYLYALMHPGETTSLKLLTQYNSRGDVSTHVSGLPRLVDISI